MAQLASSTLQQRASWAVCRAGLLAYWCRRLRTALAAERRARLVAEGEVAAREVALLVQAQQQQRQMLACFEELKRVRGS